MTEKSELQLLCEKLEHWETPEWAARAILRKELLTQVVVDSCVGTGVLSKAAEAIGHEVVNIDIHDWGHRIDLKTDFLALDDTWPLPAVCDNGFSVLMNPPFSLSEKFVDKSFDLGTRKIVCFQKFSWYEGSFDTGKKRGQWWANRRPSRIWICGDRADCWRHDIPVEDRTSSTPTAYAFFVWEQGHLPAAITGHIYKKDAV